MPAHAELDFIRQTHNPIKVLTSGIERRTEKPFFTSGKWRFAERVRWWDDYDKSIPVVIGHYWRRIHSIDRSRVGKEDPDLFEGIHPLAWHGRRNNVFCVDFSVGCRWQERRHHLPIGRDFKLAALRWPERTLMFDDGTEQETRV